jgi:hypothetical protein
MAWSKRDPNGPAIPDQRSVVSLHAPPRGPTASPRAPWQVLLAAAPHSHEGVPACLCYPCLRDTSQRPRACADIDQRPRLPGPGRDRHVRWTRSGIIPGEPQDLRPRRHQEHTQRRAERVSSRAPGCRCAAALRPPDTTCHAPLGDTGAERAGQTPSTPSVGPAHGCRRAPSQAWSGPCTAQVSSASGSAQGGRPRPPGPGSPPGPCTRHGGTARGPCAPAPRRLPTSPPRAVGPSRAPRARDGRCTSGAATLALRATAPGPRPPAVSAPRPAQRVRDARSAATPAPPGDAARATG